MRRPHQFPTLALRVVHIATALALTVLSAAGHTAPLPATTFFQPHDLSHAVLSPDGRMVALVTRPKGTRAGVIVLDLATMKPQPLARYAEGDIDLVFWLNDKRLGYSVINVSRRVVETTSGLFAVNADGTESIGFSRAIPDKRSFMGFTYVGDPASPINGVWPQNSDSMLIMRSVSNYLRPVLQLV